MIIKGNFIELQNQLQFKVIDKVSNKVITENLSDFCALVQMVQPNNLMYVKNSENDFEFSISFNTDILKDTFEKGFETGEHWNENETDLNYYEKYHYLNEEYHNFLKNRKYE